jgi:hypothetical protein
MIIKNTGIYFADQEIPVVTEKDLKVWKRESHKIATLEMDTGEQYTLRGKKGFGFFAVRRNK